MKYYRIVEHNYGNDLLVLQNGEEVMVAHISRREEPAPIRTPHGVYQAAFLVDTNLGHGILYANSSYNFIFEECTQFRGFEVKDGEWQVIKWPIRDVEARAISDSYSRYLPDIATGAAALLVAQRAVRDDLSPKTIVEQAKDFIPKSRSNDVLSIAAYFYEALK